MQGPEREHERGDDVEDRRRGHVRGFSLGGGGGAKVKQD